MSDTDECPTIPDLMTMMADHIAEVTGALDEETTAAFLKEMLHAKRIYVTGAGRSGLIAKAFAMRLMHTGLDAYVVGETITPAMAEGDTLVTFSGSGETHSIAEYAETAKSVGGTICLITAHKNSSIGSVADLIVELKTDNGMITQPQDGGYEIRQLTGKYRSTSQGITPQGTLFETMAMVFADATIAGIMLSTHCGVDDVQRRFANIQ